MITARRISVNQHEDKKTAVGYIRVSSEEQVEGCLLKCQVVKITECDQQRQNASSTEQGESA